MTSCALDLLLVRPAVPSPAAARLRVGVPELYVLVEAGAPPDEPPLASCTVVRLGDALAQVVDLAVEPGHQACDHDRRLLAEVSDILRAAGARRLIGTAINSIEL